MCDDINILSSLLDSSSDESTGSLSEILLCDSDTAIDSVEEKVLAFYSEKPKRQCVRNYLEIIPSYNEQEFIQRFRISKQLYEHLCKDFQSSKTYQKLRPDKRSSVELHLTVFLWFAGHETCSFRDLGHLFNLSTSTASRLIDRSLDYLSGLTANTIKWPSEARMKQTSSFFQTKTDIPNVIGVIGFTNIEVLVPNNQKEEGHISLTLQAVCDDTRKFLDIFIGFPGPPEECSIFESSTIHAKLKEICGNFHIVGDSTYPSTKNLLIPYCDDGHLTGSQRIYNSKLDSCRIVVTYTFRLLKQRFPQLNYCKLRGRKKLSDFVKACCVLHNLADENDFDFAKEPSPTNGPEQCPAVFKDEICKQLLNITELD